MDARRQFNGTIGGSISTTPQQRLRRSGSFSANLSARQDGEQVGAMKLEHSGSARVTTITSIMNMKPGAMRGVGDALFKRAEHVAKQMGSTELQTTLTAPEAQGFYRHMGMQPHPDMFRQFKTAMPELSDGEIAARVPIWKKDL